MFTHLSALFLTLPLELQYQVNKTLQFVLAASNAYNGKPGRTAGDVESRKIKVFVGKAET